MMRLRLFRLLGAVGLLLTLLPAVSMAADWRIIARYDPSNLFRVNHNVAPRA